MDGSDFRRQHAGVSSPSTPSPGRLHSVGHVIVPGTSADVDSMAAADDVIKTLSSTVPPAVGGIKEMSFAVMALIIVASLCAVVGLIYMLIYFKSIKPMSARSRSYKDGGGGAAGQDESRKKTAHPFFRHK